MGCFRLAAIIPRRFAYRASPASFVIVSSAGNGALSRWNPSLVTCSTVSSSPFISTDLTSVTVGMTINSANTSGTWLWSQSDACLPQSMRSAPPEASIAPCSARAVPMASKSPVASSSTKTRLSAPIASGFFITSMTKSLPTEYTVISHWMPASRNLSATSTAFISKPLTIG